MTSWAGAGSEIGQGGCVVALGGVARRRGFLGLGVSNIGQTCLSTAAHDLSGRKAEAPSSCHSANPSEREDFPG